MEARIRGRLKVTDMKYFVVIHRDKKGHFGASFLEAAGCTAVGETLEETIENAKASLELYFATQQELGRQVPEPVSYAYVEQHAPKKGFFLITTVDVEIEDKTVRVNITLPARALQKIDRAAKKKKVSRSAYITESALQAAEGESG